MRGVCSFAPADVVMEDVDEDLDMCMERPILKRERLEGEWMERPAKAFKQWNSIQLHDSMDMNLSLY